MDICCCQYVVPPVEEALLFPTEVLAHELGEFLNDAEKPEGGEGNGNQNNRNNRKPKPDERKENKIPSKKNENDEESDEDEDYQPTSSKGKDLKDDEYNIRKRKLAIKKAASQEKPLLKQTPIPANHETTNQIAEPLAPSKTNPVSTATSTVATQNPAQFAQVNLLIKGIIFCLLLLVVRKIGSL